MARADDSSSASAATTSVSPGEDGGHHGGGLPGRLLAKLDLSDDQKTKVEALRVSYQAKAKDLWSQVKSEHEALDQLLLAHVAADQATTEHKKLQGLMDQLGDLRFAEMYDIGGILTAAQRTQLAELQKEMFQKFRHHKHHSSEQDSGAED